MQLFPSSAAPYHGIAKQFVTLCAQVVLGIMRQAVRVESSRGIAIDSSFTLSAGMQLAAPVEVRVCRSLYSPNLLQRVDGQPGLVVCTDQLDIRQSAALPLPIEHQVTHDTKGVR
jgi:hypothetical protein